MPESAAQTLAPDTPDTPAGRGLDRRRLLGRGAAVAAGVAGASAFGGLTAAPALAAGTTRSRLGTAPPRPSLGAPGVTSRSPYVTADQSRLLLRRAGYGVTAADLADVERLGHAGWVNWQLNPNAIPDTLAEQVVARMPELSWPIWQVNAAINNGTLNGWTQMTNTVLAQVVRAAWSKRQLLSVMEDFWSNHFNVTCPGDGVDANRADYANIIRANALGKFSTLLTAISTHPAMLTYLGNYTSTYQLPNENQGRELLELHTVGINAGYGEVGVQNSARILTGLSISSDSGEFLYEPWKHYAGRVTVLGFTDPNPTQTGGLGVAVRYLSYLAHHPDTATRIATKLATHFVSDNPPASLVAELAHTYLVADTDIATVLRQLFASPQFAESAGQKTLRPYEHLISVVRLLGLQPDTTGTNGPQAFVYQAADGGHQPLYWPEPDGYPDVTLNWASTGATLSRWNQTLSLTAGWYPNTLVRQPLATYLLGPHLPATHGQLIDTIALKLFGRTLTPTHSAALLSFVGAASTSPVTASSPAASWYLPYLTAVMLDSPYHLYS